MFLNIVLLSYLFPGHGIPYPALPEQSPGLSYPLGAYVAGLAASPGGGAAGAGASPGGRLRPGSSWGEWLAWRRDSRMSALALSSFSGLDLTNSCGSCGRNATAEVLFFL